MTAQDTTPAKASSFAPLRQPVFAVLWAATILGNTGTFMRDVASSWIVTDLSASPTAVAMIQAAGMLPVFLLALPAGVLSDILDRRRFLIGIQIFLGCVSGLLMTLAWFKLLTVSALVTLTFLGGVGAALMAPTWQSIVPELVEKRDLRNAVALNSLGINIARSIGPALGGLILAGLGAAATYGADVASYLIVITALLWWKRPAQINDELSEHFAGAFRAGLRYVRSSHDLHIVLLRAAIFFAFASAVWALLPFVAKGLNGGPGFYGLLLGAVGAGAIGGALVMPALREKLGADGLVLTASIVTALVMAALTLPIPKFAAGLLMLLLGAAWITVLTTFNGVAQAILPNWVRGRALAVYLMVFNGAMAGGSLAWGSFASATSTMIALLVCAAGLLVAAFIMHRVPLPAGEADLAPSSHWPEPLTASAVEHDRGPVLILIEYRIAVADRSKFLDSLSRLSDARRRDGAYAWGITEDSADPEKIVEWFMVESWGEHLRQHRRVSKAAADIQQELLRCHIGPEPPVVRHFLALEARPMGAGMEPPPV